MECIHDSKRGKKKIIYYWFVTAFNISAIDFFRFLNCIIFLIGLSELLKVIEL